MPPTSPKVQYNGRRVRKLFDNDWFGGTVDGRGFNSSTFPAQLKRFLWDRGCIEGLCRGWLRGVRGY
jgi:hypothetical protein